MISFNCFSFVTALFVLLACLWCCCDAEKIPPQFVIDLATNSSQRWTKIYDTLMKDKEYRAIFTDMMFGIQDDLVSSNCFDECIKRIHASYKNKYPDYYDELLGIYDSIHSFLNITFEQFVASQLEFDVNMLFIPDDSSDEMENGDIPHRKGRGARGCTSVVTCDSKRHVLLGRNLEWGDGRTLAKLMFIVNFTYKGRLIFQAHQVPGHLGPFSGVRLNGFSIAFNAREVDHYPTLDQFLDCLDAVPLQPLMTGLRYYLEHFESYADLFKNLTNTYYCVPRFTIIGGLDGSGGRFQHNYADEPNNFTSNYTPCVLGEELQCQNQAWFVAEANSDLNTPLSDDPRRKNVMEHLKKEGRASGATSDGLYEAMTMHKVRQIDTVHTSIMSAEKGDIKTVAFDTEGCSVFFGTYSLLTCLFVSMLFMN